MSIHLTAITRPLFALAALTLAACAIPTKLAELSDGDDTSGPGTSGEPTTGGNDSTPINSGGSGSDSGGPGTTGDGCTKTTRAPQSNVVLVLDKSGSMVSEQIGLWDHDGDVNTAEVTHWSSLHTVVVAVLGEFAGAIDFGAQLVPGLAATAQYDANACSVSATIDVAVAPDNGDALLAAIPEGNDITLQGGSPTTAAMVVAIAHLKTLDPAAPRALVLVTDGAANCADGTSPPELFEDYDDALATVVGDAFTNDAIATHVIGIAVADATTPTVQDGTPDGVNPFTELNALATAGGRPRNDPGEQFFNVDDEDELAAAFAEIVGQNFSCVIPLGAVVSAPTLTVVEIDGTPVAHVTDCSSEHGWVFTDVVAPAAIELCGSACADLQAEGAADVTLCE